MSVAIIDYGAGNLKSVLNAFEQITEDVSKVEVPEELINYSHVVLPGVGSFGYAAEKLKKEGWDKAIKKHCESDKYLMGICLGMQLLFETSEEHGINKGLNLIPGHVESMNTNDSKLILPHVGWNTVTWTKDDLILDGIRQDIDFYHVHSFACRETEEDFYLAESNYGGKFVTAVKKDNIYGFQFHPEKSQPAGLKLIENFVFLD